MLPGILAQGFTLLRTAGQLPGPAPGWQLHLTVPAARLLTPEGEVAYDGGIDPPPGWLDLVHSAAACVVLLGVIGLAAGPYGEPDVADLRRLLNQAARDGALAGAIIPAS